MVLVNLVCWSVASRFFFVSSFSIDCSSFLLFLLALLVLVGVPFSPIPLAAMSFAAASPGLRRFGEFCFLFFCFVLFVMVGWMVGWMDGWMDGWLFISFL
jgi:hypothetical protein